MNQRDRIVAALKSLSGPGSSGDLTYEGMADMVLEALDLGTPCAATGCRMRQLARRRAEPSSQLKSTPGDDLTYGETDE
jgi:hypothetical protein